MATIDGIGLAEPSTITKSLAAVEIERNSSVTYQEVMVIGSPNSTTALALAEVLGSAPASTVVGLAVRTVGDNRAVLSSTQADNKVTVYQSTAAALQVQITAPSTSNSSNYLAVRITDGSAFQTPAIDYTHDGAVTASTVTGPAVLLRASAAAPTAVSADDDMVLQWGMRNGAAVVVPASSGGALAAFSTSAPSSNANGLIVRPVVSGMQTYAASTTGNSSATTIVSSAAGSRAYVYAYTITSTISGSAPQCGFYDGATLKWPVKLSSGFAGANLAVSPPAYLFSGSTGAALTFNVADSNAGMTVGIAYWVST